MTHRKIMWLVTGAVLYSILVTSVQLFIKALIT